MFADYNTLLKNLWHPSNNILFIPLPALETILSYPSPFSKHWRFETADLPRQQAASRRAADRQPVMQDPPLCIFVIILRFFQFFLHLFQIPCIANKIGNKVYCWHSCRILPSAYLSWFQDFSVTKFSTGITSRIDFQVSLKRQACSSHCNSKQQERRWHWLVYLKEAIKLGSFWEDRPMHPVCSYSIPTIQI